MVGDERASNNENERGGAIPKTRPRNRVRLIAVTRWPVVETNRAVDTSPNLVKKRRASVSFSLAFFFLWWLCFRVLRLVDPLNITVYSNKWYQELD